MGELNSVKPGDMLMIVSTGWPGSPDTIRRVQAEKVTKNHIVLKNSLEKWRISSGTSVTSGQWSRARLMAWDSERFEENRARIHVLKLRSECKSVDWYQLDEEVMRTVHGFLFKNQTEVKA